MTRTTMTRTAITRRAAMGGVALATLGGCGLLPGQDEGPTVEPEQDDPDEGDTGDDTDEQDGDTGDDGASDEGGDEDGDDTASDGGGAAGSGTEVQIGETFTDEDLGDTFTVVSAIRDMPSERHASFIEEGGEVVYLQVEISPSGEYGGAISNLDWHINVGEPNEENAEVQLANEITENGYEPLETYGRTDGDSGPLWLAFTIHEERKDTYTAAYVRPEGEVLDSGETIAEFRHEFEIPSA